MNSKPLIVFFLLFFAISLPATAQEDAEKEEVKAKVETVLTRLDETLKLEKTKRKIIEEIFTDFYTGQQKLKNEIQRPASVLSQGLVSQNFQSVRKKNEALLIERENRLKKEFSESDYKLWKEEVEPTLHKKNRKKNE